MARHRQQPAAPTARFCGRCGTRLSRDGRCEVCDDAEFHFLAGELAGPTVDGAHDVYGTLHRPVPDRARPSGAGGERSAGVIGNRALRTIPKLSPDTRPPARGGSAAPRHRATMRQAIAVLPMETVVAAIVGLLSAGLVTFVMR